MAATLLSPHLLLNPKLSIQTSASKFPTPKSRSTPKIRATFSDPFVLQIAESLEDSLSSSSTSSPPPLQKLRDASSQTVLSTPWPSRKDEPFRFTDTSLIRYSQVTPISHPPTSIAISTDTQFPNLCIVDGHIVYSLSNLSQLPTGVFVGSLSSLPSETITKRVSEFVANFEGDLFWSLNGLGTLDMVVVYVPAGCRVEMPLHIVYYSVEMSGLRSYLCQIQGFLCWWRREGKLV